MLDLYALKNPSDNSMMRLEQMDPEMVAKEKRKRKIMRQFEKNQERFKKLIDKEKNSKKIQ